MLMVVLVPLALGVRKVLESVAYRTRARGKAEVIRAERGLAPSRRERPGRADG